MVSDVQPAVHQLLTGKGSDAALDAVSGGVDLVAGGAVAGLAGEHQRSPVGVPRRDVLDGQEGSNISAVNSLIALGRLVGDRAQGARVGGRDGIAGDW